MKFNVGIIARNGIVAALYVVLTLLSYPISFGLYQLRIAEILVLLCFFRKDYTIGLTVGCLIVNFFSFEIGIIDVLIGTVATLLSCLLVGFCKHLLIACLIPIVTNGLLVGFELYHFVFDKATPFMVCAGFVALGELGAMLIGYLVFMLLRNRKKFFNFIDAQQNQEFKW